VAGLLFASFFRSVIARVFFFSFVSGFLVIPDTFRYLFFYSTLTLYSTLHYTRRIFFFLLLSIKFFCKSFHVYHFLYFFYFSLLKMPCFVKEMEDGKGSNYGSIIFSAVSSI
jgi:hypothetical protein